MTRPNIYHIPVLPQKTSVWYFLEYRYSCTGFGGFGIDDTFPNIDFNFLCFCHKPESYSISSDFGPTLYRLHYILTWRKSIINYFFRFGGKLEYRYSYRGFGKLSDLLNTQLTVVKPVIHDTYILTVVYIVYFPRGFSLKVQKIHGMMIDVVYGGIPP